MKKTMFILAALCAAFALTSCGRYDKPVFVDIGNSETPFLIKKEGDGKTATTQTAADLLAKRVMSKRIAITYRWQQYGRMPLDGRFIPLEQLILVDRSPCTREWNAEIKKGSKPIDQALWVESSDSVSFSTGIGIVARIVNEDDAAKFLFNYPASRSLVVKGSGDMWKDDYVVKAVALEDIMDTEVRSVIQRVFAEEAARYTMDEGRTKKNEIMEVVRKECEKYFLERGITITSIGMFGGLTYENPEIQKAIDNVFQAQQDKNVAKAEFDAATERQKALKAKGEGEASQQIAAAQGLSEAAKLKAQGEAEAIKTRADAQAYELSKLMENPSAYMALRQLEIEKVKWGEKWLGSWPTWISGNDSKFLFSTPAPMAAPGTNPAAQQ